MLNNLKKSIYEPNEKVTSNLVSIYFDFKNIRFYIIIKKTQPTKLKIWEEVHGFGFVNHTDGVINFFGACWHTSSLRDMGLQLKANESTWLSQTWETNHMCIYFWYEFFFWYDICVYINVEILNKRKNV